MGFRRQCERAGGAGGRGGSRARGHRVRHGGGLRSGDFCAGARRRGWVGGARAGGGGGRWGGGFCDWGVTGGGDGGGAAQDARGGRGCAAQGGVATSDGETERVTSKRGARGAFVRREGTPGGRQRHTSTLAAAANLSNGNWGGRAPVLWLLPALAALSPALSGSAGGRCYVLQVCTVRKESVTDEEGIFWVLLPPNLFGYLECFRCVTYGRGIF